MKIKTAVILGALTLGTTARADVDVGRSSEDVYRAKETSVSVFGSWLDKDNSDIAPGVALSYFFTRNIGVSASTFWENSSGTFIDNVAGEGIFRLPLGDMPLAPYGLIGIGYSFESEEVFEYVGAGAEWRFNPKLGIFADLRWQWNDDTDDSVGVRFGGRITF